MKRKKDNYLYVHAMAAVCTFLMTIGAYAQDVWKPELRGLTSAFGATTSPYAPPTKDVFVANSGPGLDTGCTYNTDPEHPLIIDILIDRFVGEVDADGFLVDPYPLIDKGIIPAVIQVLMPAYDVDFNGTSPPERDEVVFNGERLGLLSGENNRWKLNTFAVDIKTVKFPAKPAEGSAVTPVANRVQINVDMLNTRGWCTAIDWVALEIAILPQIALILQPVEGHNPIRVNNPNSNDTIDTIYQLSFFDTDCNLREDIVSFNEYPFSGPIIVPSFFGGDSPGEVTLHTKMDICPNTNNPPNVEVDWRIRDTSLEGTETWTGLEGDVTIHMPDKVGTYTVIFTYVIDGPKGIIFERKLLVTKKPPIQQAARLPATRTLYEKVTNWASGETDEDVILEKLLHGVYAFGQNSWRYGYSFDSVEKCRWEDLLAVPITCDYADCHVFSDAFAVMAQIMGIRLSQFVSLGTNAQGFITKKVKSLDSNFTGNARPFGSKDALKSYDRYTFGMHSLRVKDFTFYDVTFDGIYSSGDAFIAYNLNGKAEDANGEEYYTTVEGVKLYKREDFVYDSWYKHEYTSPSLTPSLRISQPSSVKGNAQNIQFTGNTTFHTVDKNGDGFAEALVAEVEVAILSGKYVIEGVLRKNGRLIANRPNFESTRFSDAALNEKTGIYTVLLSFSGEQIFQSGEEGPYELALNAIESKGFGSRLTVSTPAYEPTQFGELGVIIKGVNDVAVDENGDGKFDFIETTLHLEVRTVGNYIVDGSLMNNEGSTLVNVAERFSLTQGRQDLKINWTGRPLRRSGLEGPYKGDLVIVDAHRQTVDHIEFLTQPYRSSEFAALLELDGTFNAQGIDTNRNGLFDILRIEFGANLTEAGTFKVGGVLKTQTSPRVVFSKTMMTLSTGPQTLTLDFRGPLIQKLEMDGPYEVLVMLREPTTYEMLDGVRLEQKTAAYSFTDFEPLGGPPPAISPAGSSFDKGVDLDGNGLFDELHVEIDLELTTTDFYEWSARLVDVNGTEIGFDSRTATLNEGIATIHLVFDGQLIGENGVDGPYVVKGLLIYGRTGPNLVHSSTIAETQAYRASQFEGFVPVDEKKVTVCHKPRNNPKAAHSITISKNALQAHLDHGDTLGPCQ
ncbi:MAG: hypothetical protein DRR08_08275 [Candidatus Parabeggiatoa sp. nov. 2]|nr:MAG: hypothetical protein B6247_23730 [Beggiatoa sp. 4572_84]RKZ61638.1 MAG: hypothetical protein DRR08_08275 [Gammaproteobacteria bacterium]